MGRLQTEPAPSKGASVTTTIAIPAECLTVLAPLPELVSQANVEAVTGIPPRTYLEAIRSPGFPLPVVKMGKLRIVDRAAFVAWVRSGAQTAAAVEAGPANDAGPVSGVDALAAELGYELTPKPHASAGRGRR